jgi:hypothetical protein
MGVGQCSHTLLWAWDGWHSKGLASPDPPPIASVCVGRRMEWLLNDTVFLRELHHMEL